MRIAMSLAVLIAAAAVISGCARLDAELAPILEPFEGPSPWPNERRILGKDWVRPQVEPDMEAVYCYKTLGTVECHSEPLPDGEQRRLVNKYEPPVKAPRN